MKLRTSAYALAAAVLAAGCGATGTVAQERERAAEAARINDAQRGFSLTLPAGWHRAGSNLTPQLTEPREILTVATYPLRYARRARCSVAGCPTPALNGFRATAILLSIQERMDAKPAGKDVPIALRDQRAVSARCARDRVAWFAFEPFSEAGRRLYAFVAMGKRAPASAKADLERLLASLRFSERRSTSLVVARKGEVNGGWAAR